MKEKKHESKEGVIEFQKKTIYRCPDHGILRVGQMSVCQRCERELKPSTLTKQKIT